MKLLRLSPPLYQLDDSYTFPDPLEADDDGLIAVGGDLSPNRLLSAYRKGIFPWFMDRGVIYWFSPNPRLILFPQNFKCSKSLIKTVKSKNFEIHLNRDFANTVVSCALTNRKGQDGTWINTHFVQGYSELFQSGNALSVETYIGDKLVGGLYGVKIGGYFSGESMFHTERDASKVALWALCQYAPQLGISFIDCQQSTEHLKSLGAEEFSRDEFLSMLNEVMLC